MKKWYQDTEIRDGIVLSSRVRLARNLADFPFPARLDLAGREQVCRLVRDSLANVSGLKLKYIEMQELTPKQAVALAERHIISPEFAVNERGKALLLSEDESISIMLCEEDHIRIQVIRGGFDLDGAFESAMRLDDLLDSLLHYAFDERLGYLTQCLTNLGTGMRAGVMMHLPALAKCGRMQKLSNTVSKLGLTVRGTYGEGTGAKGDVYQLSNQVSLGISERTALDNLKAIAMQIATQERAVGDELIKDDTVLDHIQRAEGILRAARLLSTEEMLELFSWLRLGVRQGIAEADISGFNELTQTMQAATLSEASGGGLDRNKRDALRAQQVRKRLFDS